MSKPFCNERKNNAIFEYFKKKNKNDLSKNVYST